MKYLGLILFSATLLGCGSQDLGNTPNKNVAGNSNGQALTFLDIKPASSLSSNTKPIKKGKSVEINGNVFEVSTLGGSESFVEGENNGYVIGGSAIPMPAEEVEGEEVSDLAVHAFVQKDGVIKDLGTLGGNYSSASGVNNSGVVVGGSQLSSGDHQAFKYEYNTLIALSNLSGGNHSWAHSINSSGCIVGEAKNASGAFKAVVWQNGTITKLNSLLPANSGWDLTNAQFISDTGVVSGVGKLNGVKTFFQLTLNITE